MPKRWVRLSVSLFLFLFVVVGLLISGNSSQLAPSFGGSLSPTQVPDQAWQKASQGAVYETENQTQSDIDESAAGQEDVLGSDQLDKSGYQVVKVVDGDTFDVNLDGKVERLRMIGIDTPETVDPRKPVQCFGKEASNKAKEILTGQFVTLELDPSQGERDKYGRLLRYAFLPDGTNYGLFMISEGYAHEYTYRLPYKYQADFKQAEIDARANNKGLWSSATCSGNK